MQRGHDTGLDSRQTRLRLPRHLGRRHAGGRGVRRHGHRGREPACPAVVRRFVHPHLADRPLRRGRHAAHRGALRRTERPGVRHRPQLRSAHRRRSVPPDGHRGHPQCGAVAAGQPQEPRRTHRNVRRRRTAPRGIGRDKRCQQEDRQREDGLHLPDGLTPRL